MKICKNDCIPCCDFCIHCKHETFEHKGEIIKGGPEDCLLHEDKKETAQSCGYCDDFHCFNVKEE